MKKYTIFITLLATLLQATDGFDYLNSFRTQAGMPVFSVQNQLEQAAQNHSDYMQINTVSGHAEDRILNGYTGDYATQRAAYTGYKAAVAENVSAGTPTVEGSIDGLFSAIYHRFGFLSLDYDEVGIGISDNNNYYTYNMGNSSVNNACTSSTASSGYTLVCVDPNEIISQTEYENRSDTIKASSVDIIVWPSVNSTNTPPVFYEESPDPLPNHSVSAYPISVEFNEGSFSSAPSMTSFTVKDGSGLNQSLITHSGQGMVMNENSDPNSKFSPYQHAIFSEQRLEWGSRYDVTLGYSFEGNAYTKNWCFTTRSLKNKVDKFYRVGTSADTILNVMSGQTYAIYIVPNAMNTNILQSYSSSTTTNLSFIDRNTISVQLTGANGTGTNLTLGTGQIISLLVSGSDAATTPKQETCTADLELSPDYKSVLTVYGGIVYGGGVHDISFDTLILNIAAGSKHDVSNPLIIRIPKNKALTLSYDSSMTSFKGDDVENNLWNFDDTDSFDYVMTYLGTDMPTSRSRFAFTGTFTTQSGGIGEFILETTIKSGTGGDSNVDNNGDRDSIFKKL
ncbi:MAG: CAP domain-containing protein [Campylobacterota bacterium]|nr:CAP domain-containing protein [Campylobacterota bacterium]